MRRSREIACGDSMQRENENPKILREMSSFEECSPDSKSEAEENKVHNENHSPRLSLTPNVRPPSSRAKNKFKSFKRDDEDSDEKDAAGELESKKTNCLYCGKRLLIVSQWYHMKKCHPEEAIRCPYSTCSAYFKSEAEKMKHVENKHESGKKKTTCSYCHKWYSKANKATHEKRCQLNIFNIRFGKGPKKVLVSSSKIEKTSAPKEAKKKEAPVEAAPEAPVEKKEEVEEPAKPETVPRSKKRGKKFICIYCAKLCSSSDVLCKHIRSLHGGAAIKCSIYKCGQFFKSEADLVHHFKNNHADKEAAKNYKCNLCVYKTVRKCDLRRHILTWHTPGSYKCNQCPKVLESMMSLKQHRYYAHIFTKHCHFCQEKFPHFFYDLHLKTGSCKVCKKDLPCAVVRSRHKLECKRVVALPSGPVKVAPDHLSD